MTADVGYLQPEAWRYLYNVPLECALRCAMLLAAAYPERLDLQRLLEYEYLLVHSGDIGNGPPSLHPRSPHRGGELLVRRRLVENGLRFALARGLVCSEWMNSGLLYFAGEWSAAFIDRLAEPYSVSLNDRARWVVQEFRGYDDRSLSTFMRAHWSSWGSEFESEALMRGSAS